jgi:hypothetical protein
MIILLDRAGFRVEEVPVIMYIDQSGQSMHSGIIRPLYYGMKMMMSIVMTMLRDDRNLRQNWQITAVESPGTRADTATSNT